MSLRLIRVSLVATLAALAFSGSVAASSPPSNNVGSRSADGIVAAALDAGVGSRSVHVQGMIKGQGLGFDLWIGANRGRGHIENAGLGFDFIRLDGSVYFKAGTAFWRKYAGRKFAPFASLFAGHWMKVSSTSGDFGAFTQLTDLPTFLRGILTSHGKLAKGGTSTRDGKSVVAVIDTSDGSTLYVATKGKPYPILLSKPGTAGGTVTFRQWGAPLNVTAPKRSIDITAYVKTHS